MQAAVLHDVLEDTSATAAELHAAGMSHEVVEAISLLTKQESMRYEDYIVRLSCNELARQVKIADIRDNYRLDRVAYRPDHRHEDRQRIERYILSYQFLDGKLTRDEYLTGVASID